MPKKVLVTGGAGFIGSHLVDRLIKEGFEVTVLDNLSTGRIDNIRRHFGKACFSFIKGDVREKRVISKAFKDFDVVFHLAAITSVPFSVKFPKVTCEVNADGTRNILEACLENNVDKFVFASSCAVYGEPKYLPIDESHPTKPLSPYAESKFEAENICRVFHKKYGLKTVILRLFNVYGPRMSGGQYGGVIKRFIGRLRVGKPPVIYGDGEQTRDFVHVEDVVEAIMSAFKNSDASGKVFNIGSGTAVTINQLANMLMDVISVNGIKPIYRKSRPNDIRHSCADIRLAKVTLGFGPKTSLKEGLARVLMENAA